MSLICFTNGSLAREEVSKRFGYDWGKFAAAIQETPPANGGRLIFPYFTAETTPRMPAGVDLVGSEDFVNWREPKEAIRAVVETQALSMRRFSEWIGHAPKQLVLTGGAARNPGILRIVADVFQCPVRTLRVGNASALGGALRAAQAAGGIAWKELFSAFVALDPDVNVQPDPQARAAYEQLARGFDEKLNARLARNI